MKKLSLIIISLLAALLAFSQNIDTIPNIDPDCFEHKRGYWEIDSVNIEFKNDSIFLSGVFWANCSGNVRLIREFNKDTIRLAALNIPLAYCDCEYDFATSFKDNYLPEYYLEIGYSGFGDIWYYYDTVFSRFPLMANNNNILNNIILYPNPTNGILKIDLRSQRLENIKFILKDVSGKILFSFKTNNQLAKYSIDLNKYSKGVYFLVISGEHLGAVKKVIKM